MKTISRYIMTLALLLTAVGGAWAQTQWESGDCTVTLSNGTLTVSGNGAMADYTQSSYRPWEDNSGDITSVVVESGVTSVRRNAFESFTNLTSVTLPEGLTAIGLYAFSNCSSLQSITIPSTVTSIGDGAFDGCLAMTSVTLPEGLTAIGGMAFGSCSSLTSITIPSTVTSIGDYAFMKSSAISDVNLYANPDNLTWGNTKMNFKQNKATQCHVLAEHLSAYQNNFSSVNVTFVGDLQPLPTPIEVTTNAAKEGATFTEATFAMPAYDVDVNYELVRDMSIQMTATMGDGTDGVRYRVKKAQQGEGYEPADLNMMQVLELVAVNDGIEQKALTLNQDYHCRIYKLDEQTLQPTGDGVELIDFDFAPGLYALKAFAQDDSNYAGETALSNTFKLFQGYEVEVAAKEFITYYKDEPLKVDESTEGAELYTVSSVNDTQVVLSSAISVAPEYTPLLVYNTTEEKKTFLLVPTDETADEVTPAAEFKGTLEAMNMGASSDDVNYYVCDGTQFVWVRSAGTIAANRCWLEISTAEPDYARAIVFGETTSVNEELRMKNEESGDWYDLQGRKVIKPTRKGVFIQNGKKVVVK